MSRQTAIFGDRNWASLVLVIVWLIPLYYRASAKYESLYAEDASKSAGLDIALEENGGAVESISGTSDPSAHFYGAGFNGRHLIDGKLEPTWIGDPAGDPSDPPHTPALPGIPLEIVLSFYKHQSVLFNDVVIIPGKDLDLAPKEIEIWVSSTSPTNSFAKVQAATLPTPSGDYSVTLPPTEARYLKVRVLSNQQNGSDSDRAKPALEIAEIKVFEAHRNGYMSIRDRNPDLVYWKGSPRFAAQRGIEWLQSAAPAWQQDHKCFGCHVQAQVVMGLTVATRNDYIVSQAALHDLVEFTTSKQFEDGTFECCRRCCIFGPQDGTPYGAMELAYWDDLENVRKDPAFLKAVDWLVAHQKPNGELPTVSVTEPVLQGSFAPTANSMVAFGEAFKQTGDARYKRALDLGLDWITSTTPETTQDEVFQILALSKFAATTQESLIQRRVEQLISEEDPGGGWREHPGDKTLGPNAFATGEVLYAFKQAGVSISSPPFLGGVRHLLKTQDESGAWPVHDSQSPDKTKYAPTMWAVIGLAGSFGKAATAGLQIVVSPDLVKPAARNIEIILDASGSMLSPLGKSTRIATAREVLRDVLAKIPDDFNVGLRVYAHRYPWKDMQHSCTDTELLLPIEKLDRQRILSAVDNLKPKGDTPLVYSVLQTPADLKPVGGGAVIVITDGQETCHGDPVKAAAELKAAGIPVTLNIVGFTLQGQEKANVERLMRPFAEAMGGHYYNAENGKALATALSVAALNKFPYEVFDANGREVAKGQAGPISESLTPGTYKLVVHAGAQELTETIALKADTNTVLKLVGNDGRFVLKHESAQAP